MSDALNTTQINETLEQISGQVLPPNMRLMYVSVDEVHEQDINAQAMSKAAFDQLVANIRDAGAPESLPLLARTQKGLEIVSGHHRIRASREAKVKMILALVYDNLSRARIHAKQLAHNSITGKSDPQIVKEIWDRIDDVAARFEAFIDPKMFDSLPQPVSFKPIDVDMGKLNKTVMFVFLSTQKMDFDEAVELLMPKTDIDQIYIAHRETFDAWIEAFKRTKADLEIVNAATALSEMARLALERLDQLTAGKD